MPGTFESETSSTNTLTSFQSSKQKWKQIKKQGNGMCYIEYFRAEGTQEIRIHNPHTSNITPSCELPEDEAHGIDVSPFERIKVIHVHCLIQDLCKGIN
jgi:hypothetical protein